MKECLSGESENENTSTKKEGCTGVYGDALCGGLLESSQGRSSKVRPGQTVEQLSSTSVHTKDTYLENSYSVLHVDI